MMKLMSIDRYILLNWINVFGFMCHTFEMMKLMSIDRYILLNWINVFGFMCKIGRW